MDHISSHKPECALPKHALDGTFISSAVLIMTWRPCVLVFQCLHLSSYAENDDIPLSCCISSAVP